MYKEIELETVDGKKKFGFAAIGSTAVRYRQVFHQDLMVQLNKLQNMDNEEKEDSVDTSVIDRLAYIMNMQAEKKDMGKLNFDTFIDWLDQFDGPELFTHMDEIVGLYIGNKAATSNPKNAPARQSGK